MSVDYMGNYVGTDEAELEHIGVSFKEGLETYVPRALFVDQDCTSSETLYSNSLGNLFDRQHELFDNTDVQNNFASV